MLVVTSDKMKELDARAIADGSVDERVLMENAGRAVVDALAARFSPLSRRRIHVVCATGNNGGDGFVAASHASLAGASVTVELIGDPSRLKPSAASAYELMIRTTTRTGGASRDADIYVDALLGTGSVGEPRQDMAPLIRLMNESGRPIIAVDIPTGLNADTGAIATNTIRAAATVTFGYPKLGLLVGGGPDVCGEIIVDAIGYPWESLSPHSAFSWVQARDVRALLPQRERCAHKGDFGHMAVVGGSAGMCGAPALTARAALRSGAGLVTIAAPCGLVGRVGCHVPEAMTIALPELTDPESANAWVNAIVGGLPYSAVCIGPGLGRSDLIPSVLRAVADQSAVPVVIDADGLNALARAPFEAPAGTTNVLTPHPGECGRLLGCSSADVQADRVSAVREVAKRYRAIVVLKGASTLICDGRLSEHHSAPVSVITTGNPGMATAGSGDVLTGVIGALCAARIDPYGAACAGAYLHGLAGDLAAVRFGRAGLVAGDIADALAAAIAQTEKTV